MSEAWFKPGIRALGAVVAIGTLASLSGCAKRTQKKEKDPPDLVTRVEVVPSAEGCPARASLVKVGLDKNGDGLLNDDEVHPPGTKLCTDTPLHVETVSVLQNEYCPPPSRIVAFGKDADQDGKFDQGIRHNIIVCLDGEQKLIRATYVVYGAR